MGQDYHINKSLFCYLTRHHEVFFPPNTLFNTDKPHLIVEDKFYQLDGNKKWLKKKLYSLIETNRPEFIDTKEKISETNKTIKIFLEESIKIKKQ
jgi:hypothetical protein